MAVASKGGHWEELMLLRPVLDAYAPDYATTDADLAARDGIARLHVLPDCNRDLPVESLRCLWRAFRLTLSIRPDVLITTGALPGLFCLITARMVGARTIWLDSIANSDRPSLSGTFARPFASLWLTQWKHLADGALRYEGALL
jgi:hypothetical protein